MLRVYTDRWNDFQFRAPSYLDGHFEPHKFDLVKWEEHEPIEVLDWVTGEKKMSTSSCFSVAQLEWDEKDECFEFKSVGLRYLDNYVDGLNEFVLKFCKMMEQELSEREY